MTKITGIHGPLIVLCVMACFTIAILAYIAIDSIRLVDTESLGAPDLDSVLPGAYQPAYAVHASSHTSRSHVLCDFVGSDCDFYDLTFDNARVIVSAHTWTAADTDRNYWNAEDLTSFANNVHLSVSNGTMSVDTYNRIVIAATQTHYHKQYQINELITDIQSLKQTVRDIEQQRANLQRQIDTFNFFLRGYECPPLKTVSPC